MQATMSLATLTVHFFLESRSSAIQGQVKCLPTTEHLDASLVILMLITVVLVRRVVC